MSSRSLRVLKGYLLLCFAALLVARVTGAFAAQKDVNAMEEKVRKPAVAGQFYTEDPKALREEILGYLKAAAPPAVAGEVIAIVAPHAGYQYSGLVAAHAYRLIRGARYDAVVVISPCHVEHFGFSAVYPGDAYLTPLGTIPIDAALARLIAEQNDLVRMDMKGHESSPFRRSEHSLEVQLPFLQVALGDFTFVPIVMGDQSRQTVEALGAALSTALAGRRALIVASTDLSHFHDDRTARGLDGVFQERLRAFDPAKLSEALSREGTEACGGGPTVAAMIAAKKLGATACTVLNYANSGDVTGDAESVVGYVSAVMVKGTAAKDKQASPAGGRAKPAKGSSTPSGLSGSAQESEGSALTIEDKKFLLALARNDPA